MGNGSAQTLLTGTNQTGILVNLLASSSATVQVNAAIFMVKLDNTTFTTAEASGLKMNTWTKGASNTITRGQWIQLGSSPDASNSALISDNVGYTGTHCLHFTNTNPSKFTGLVGVKQAITNVDDTLPTQAELVTALGAANLGTGMIGVIKDNDADTNFFIGISNGTSWYALKLTKGS